MEHIFTHTISLSNTKVIFTYGPKAYSKVMKHYTKNKHKLTNQGLTTELVQNGHVMYIVSLNKLKGYTTANIHGLLVHEINHVVTYYMNHYHLQDDELRSMLMQALYVDFAEYLETIALA